MPDEDRRAEDLEFASILKGYLQYEAGKKDLTTWTGEALKRIEHLRKVDERNEMYLLVHAHICLIRGRRMRRRRFWSPITIIVLQSEKMWN